MTRRNLSNPEKDVSRDLHAFQAFTASLVQEENEQLVAELVASSLPSFFEGLLGVVALRSEGSESGWNYYGSIGGSPLDAAIVEELRGVISLLDSPRGQETKTMLGADVPATLRRLELQALHMLPVRTLEQSLGILLLGTCASVALSAQNEALLSSLASHLAMVLENARLRRVQREYSLRLENTVGERTAELQRKEEEQRALLEINRAISAHLEREDLFHAIAKAVRSVIVFDRLGIILPRPGEDDLILYAFETENEVQYLRPGITFPRAGTIPGWVFESKRPFVGSGPEDFEPFPVSRDILTKEGVQSTCVLPLLVKDRTVGVLAFMGKERGLFDPANLPFLVEMAAAFAVALDNSLAYGEIKQLKDRLNQENIYLQEEIKTDHNFEEIVGKSQALKKVLKKVEKVAGTDSSVLITGETGTGKELIARAIHYLSNRKDRPLINVNCPALPTGLIESELFGHERGAFTGALSRKIGRFELADKGTIFLDEIGDLPHDLQAKLLRVLQENEFERVGGTQSIKVNVRLIAATNRDLEEAVEDKSFRADLYYRLNVFPISLPPLRERKEDIEFLVQYFVNKHMLPLGRRIEEIGHETMRQLMDYPWPGNIRELENVIERAVILSKGPTLEIGDELAASPNLMDQGESESLTLEEVERAHIVTVLEKTRGIIEGPKGAARILNLHPNTLRGRMKKLGIKRAYQIQ